MTSYLQEQYEILCPQCNREDIKFTFAGNNGYISFCKTCQCLLYFCSIFQKIDVFKPTKKRYDMTYQKLIERGINKV